MRAWPLAVAVPSGHSPAAVRAGAWGEVLAWCVLSRAVVFAAMLGLDALRAPNGYFTPRVFSGIGPLGTWDGRWYQIVAERGYLLIDGRQSDPAFFPLYPMLLRGAHALGLSYVGGGVVLSNLFLLAAVVAFYELGRRLVPEPDARRAAAYVALCPLGYVFSLVYPQSLVLLAIALAGLAALEGRWLAAASAVALGTLARPEALFVALPIAVLAARRWPELRAQQRAGATAAVLAGPAALAAFSGYLAWALGDPLAWSHAQEAWGRRFHPLGPVDALTGFPDLAARWGWAWRDLAFLLLYLAVLALGWRRGVPRAWILAAVAILLIPLASGSVVSEARFGLLAVAAYWGLAVVGRRRALDVALRVVSLALLAGAILTIALAYP